MKLSQNKIIILIFLMAAITCFFAVYLRLFTEKELWYEMFAAILGVIITAVITMVLLKGQTTNDVERERAAKVFEEKLRIYQEYLQILCNVIEDRCLSDEEKIRLEFQTSYVAMHCEPKYIVDVSILAVWEWHDDMFRLCSGRPGIAVGCISGAMVQVNCFGRMVGGGHAGICDVSHRK